MSAPTAPAVALVTCGDLPDGDEDFPAIIEALARLGIDARPAVWDDPAEDWASYALAVVRSTWDYTARREEFLRWAATVPRLANPAAVLAWNSDKTYLRDMHADGVDLVPTLWLEPGEAAELPDGEIVVKPSVGAGSKGAGRFAAEAREQALAHARMLHDAGRTVLVQPYLDGVDAVGETSLVYFDGTFSHAITKAAMLPAGTAHPLDGQTLFVEERITAATPSAAERSLGDRVVRAIGARFAGNLLYARVDLLPAATGPVLVELELTEPSLFLANAGHPGGAADALASAVARRIREVESR